MNYFVSYVVVGSNTLSYGNVDIKTSAPITEMSHVRDVERIITDDLSKGGRVGRVFVLNYIVLSE